MIVSADGSMEPKKWLKVTLHVPIPLIEAASDLMGVLSGSGVEQSPETPEGCSVSGFFPLEPADNQELQVEEHLEIIREQMEELFQLYNMAFEGVETTLMDDADWATSWQEFFTPFEIIPGLVIKPSWETFEPDNNQKILELDPGMAFGTGQHASTRMALLLLSQTEPAGKRILDVGTGTGILAMAGILLGATEATAIDNDPEAVEVAEENIASNGMSELISVSLTPLEMIQENYEVICANIVHNVLIDMAADLARCSVQDGALILAGILAGEQEENIIQTYTEHGFLFVSAEYTDEWVALRFRYAG
ncbi:50S ribosomal protein L11 methyltransferase [Desulfogranum japonicum]|uniref:50S ribosomal protein L11 methyltransferase n=1 Tax=Desulfogranum japonicum TaxID=231447 RepID=UPI000687343F|nr:50S ribosomal protein L11 methyltransferase [Desulfogranum japonicum]